MDCIQLRGGHSSGMLTEVSADAVPRTLMCPRISSHATAVAGREGEAIRNVIILGPGTPHHSRKQILVHWPAVPQSLQEMSEDLSAFLAIRWWFLPLAVLQLFGRHLQGT